MLPNSLFETLVLQRPSHTSTCDYIKRPPGLLPRRLGGQLVLHTMWYTLIDV